jgi:Fur family peroxide stress response transcriptional regulator
MKEKRQTIQKGLVWDAVSSTDTHPSAEQVYADIVTKYPSISRATVYRNLNMLVEEGKLRRIQVLGGPDHYDHMMGKHYHIQCIDCKEVGDVEVFSAIDLGEDELDLHGYELHSYEIVFNGICPDCQKKRAAQGQ